MVKEVEAAQTNENLAITKKEAAERERDVALDVLRDKRRGELRDKYDNELRNNRIKLIGIPIIVGIISFITIKYGLKDTRDFVQYLIGCSVELIFGLLPLIPLNKQFVRKHSEYVNGIDNTVENEILELKKKAV